MNHSASRFGVLDTLNRADWLPLHLLLHNEWTTVGRMRLLSVPSNGEDRAVGT
jgi:hypothetical protein